MNLKRIENFHVALWLLKDCSWSQQWIVLGMTAALPALYLQIYLAWHHRHDGAEELIHNIAICFWIAANIVWMTGEFFWNTEDRWLNQWFFFTGMGLLLAFYLYQLAKRLRAKFSTVHRQS